jgi:hypothetical protein
VRFWKARTSVSRERELERRRRGQDATEHPAGSRTQPSHAALLALQRGAGNQAVGRALQRMHLIATEAGTVESDPVVLMNIRHGQTVNKGRGVETEKIAAFADAYSGDDLDFEHREIVFLHGHGVTGMYRDDFALTTGGKVDAVTYDAAADIVAAKLKTVTKEEKKGKPYEIRILTCRGGNPGMEQGDKQLSIAPMPSMVKALQQKLASSPSLVTIKGFVQPAFSYPGYKTHQEPDQFTDTAYELHLKVPFKTFETWLATDEGKKAGYPERLKKIEELIPQDTVVAFMTELRKLGAYSKADAEGDQSRRETFLKVVNRTT